MEVKVKVTQSCLTLGDPVDYTVHGILQARIPENTGYPFPSLGDLPNPGIEPRSRTLQVNSLPAEPQGKPMKRKFRRHLKAKEESKDRLYYHVRQSL